MGKSESWRRLQICRPHCGLEGGVESCELRIENGKSRSRERPFLLHCFLDAVPQPVGDLGLALARLVQKGIVQPTLKESLEVIVIECSDHVGKSLKDIRKRRDWNRDESRCTQPGGDIG